MNEFIIWDDEDNKFIIWENVVFTKDKDDDFIIIMKEIDPIVSEGRNFKSFNYIGKKDINNNKIYADSSICEIAIKHRTDGNRISIGYFVFNLEYLRHEVVFIDGYMKGKKEFYNGFMYRFKIIDTIQQNKLGLIK